MLGIIEAGSEADKKIEKVQPVEEEKKRKLQKKQSQLKKKK